MFFAPFSGVTHLVQSLFNRKSNSTVKDDVQLTLITQFYPPDFAATGQFMDELAQNLTTQGMQVQVFTGQPSYAFDATAAKAPEVEKMGEVLVRRSNFLRSVSRKWAGRTISSLAFCAHAALHLLKREHRGDILLLTSEPPFLQVLGYLIKLVFGVPFATLVYDLYPDVAVELEVLSQNHWLIRFWDSVNRRVWNAADSIVVPCQTMKDRIVAKVPEVSEKIIVIHNWADPTWIKPMLKAQNSFAQEHQLTEKFTVLYSGNMGRCHDMDTIMGAAVELQNEPVEFLFVGGGPKREECKQQAAALGLQNCRFLPYQDKARLPESLTACDLSLVSVDVDMEGLVAPSKFYSALSAGRPVAIICEKHSYLRSLVSDANCGAAISNGDSKGLAGFIRYLMKDPEMTERMGKAGHRYIQEYFTPHEISQQYFRILRRAVLNHADLHQAVEQEEFCIHYQPMMEIGTRKILGVEATIRWQHPTRGLICPAEFESAAHETGLIVPLGWWLLQGACQQLQTWRQQHPKLDLQLSINLSSQQFFHPELVSRLDAALQQYDLPGNALMLEIKDQVVMEDAAATTAILLQLQTRNIQVCIDNFGEGYSTLDYLHRFPISALKVDKSLVSRIGVDPKTVSLIETIVILAKDLRMKAIAVGVESTEQLLRLKEVGLKYAQGYLFAPSQDAEQTSTFLETCGQQELVHPLPAANLPVPVTSASDETKPLVLIVDDDRSMRSILRTAISQAGYRTVEAENGTAGLAKFHELKPDLVLLDALMPDMDGFACCHAIRQSIQAQAEAGGISTAVRSIPILMITALDDSESVDQAFAAGATDYVTKPINWAVLRQRLQRLLPTSPAKATVNN
ncbi:EAL domain-containing protein [Alkalinema sp. FACHB-956]|uniref:EAL domain-containing protein n=1 Tax=Alkalinema sp. FACHB-956 TaxID=2692768 RepID=UPI00168981B2|nr:EAL domain-containing protein [Alkalinema sp. FACHB-956]MBD2325543.1 EAL domain-containing protein [Alkalinema sp. FACHB-956]